MSGNPQFPQTRKPLNPDAKAAPLFDYMPQMSLEERNRRWDKVRKKMLMAGLDGLVLIGDSGELVVVDITAQARSAYVTGARGRKGELATWQFEYTKDYPDQYFDCVAVIQAVQHTDDWTETGVELLRVMKSGRRLVLAEITFGPNMINAASLDIHVESWVEKIFSRMGWAIEQFPYYSPKALHEALDSLMHDTQDFCWKGIELFWGTKP